MSKYNSRIPPEAVARMFEGLNDFMKDFGIKQINMGSKAIARTKGKFAKPIINSKNKRNTIKSK